MLATPECTQAQPSALCDGGVMINLHRESCWLNPVLFKPHLVSALRDSAGFQTPLVARGIIMTYAEFPWT